MVFLRKRQHSQQGARSTHPTFPTSIHRWPSRECGEVFIAPYLACVSTLILAIFFLNRAKKTSLTIEQQYWNCCLLSDSCIQKKNSLPLDNLVHQIEEGKMTSVEGRLYSPPQALDDRTFYLLEIESIETEAGAKKGFPLMIHCDNDLEEKEVELPLNSKLICYTDGFTEARGMDEEMYGLERLNHNAQEMGKTMNAENLGQELKSNVQTYLNGCEFTHDFTLIALEVQPTP